MSSYSGPVPGPWAQPSTVARASSIEESEAGAEWDGRAGHEHEHTPAPAILHQASSARSPITLPHTPTASPSLARLPRYPFLGTHAQSLRGGALVDMAGRGTGQQRAAETLRQQAAAEEQQMQAEHAGDQQQQPAGAQGADMGAMQTPPAQQQPSPRMVSETALRALSINLNGSMHDLRGQVQARDRQQDERDERIDAEFARVHQVRAPMRMHDDAHLSSLLLGAFLSLDASCAQQVLQHPASVELPQHVLEHCASLVQYTPSPFPELTEQENSAMRGLITQLQQEVGGARSEIETQLRPFAVQRIHELRQRVDQLQLSLMQQNNSLPALTPQLVEQIVTTVTDRQMCTIMDGLATLGTTLLRGSQAGGQQEEGDDEPTPAELAELEQAERRVQQVQQARQESAMRQPPPPPAPAPAPALAPAAPMPPPPAAPIFAPPVHIPPEPVKTGPWQPLPPPPPTNPYSTPPLAMPAPATGYEQVNAGSLGVNLAKFMHKPAAFSGAPTEDVDTALYAFETYLSLARIPMESWATVAMTMLKGQASQAWMSVVIPLKRAGIEPTWAHFCKCLHDFFGPPDKELHARKAFRALRQGQMSVQEYVRHAKSLLARLVTSPPSEADKTVALFEGLDPIVKQAAPVDPCTGRAWKTFDDLAGHIITLEQQAPRKLQRDRAVDVLTRGFKKPSPRVTFAAPL